MSEATAQHSSEGLADFLVGRFRFLVKYGLCGQDYATKAKTALGGPFVDERLLDGVKFLRCAEAFERRNLVGTNRAHGHHTRTHDMASQNHRTGSALGHAAPKLRATQSKFVA